jgi:hypothetical protein
MSTIELEDTKGRLFVVSYDYHDGFGSDRYRDDLSGFESDEWQTVINGAVVVLSTNKKTRKIALTPDELFEYIKESEVIAEIEQNETRKLQERNY